MVAPWTAVCLQTATVSLANARTRDEIRATVAAGVRRIDGLIERHKASGPGDLFLLPEKVLGDREDDLRGCLRFSGPEIAGLQQVAAKHRVYIGANCYTLNEEFPGRYFNTSFVIDRSGAVILKSYRLHTYHSTSPHDFWQRFIDKVGIDGAFPVAKTELGNLAILPSMELMFPEIARIFVLRGAEVLMHTTMDKIVDQSVKRARATENMAFVMSANVTGNVGSDEFMKPDSIIVNWRGQVLAQCPAGDENSCSATIEIDPLRQRRVIPDFTYPPYGVNYLSRLRTEIAATGYAAAALYPVDTYKDGDVVTAAISPATANKEKLKQSLRNMARAGMVPAELLRDDL